MVRDLTVPMHIDLNWRAFSALFDLRGSCCFTKFPDGPNTNKRNVLWLKKMQPRYAWLSEVKASHSQTMGTEVSTSAPHFLHNGLSDSPIRWRFLFRVLIRTVTALHCVLQKDRNPALAPREGSEINARTCLWVSPRSRQHIQYWLPNQRVILLRITYRQTPKTDSGATNFRTQLSLVS